jgi:drug/metabolite transporter (DMT)-like permease
MFSPMPQWLINTFIVIGALLVSIALNYTLGDSISSAFGILLGGGSAVWAFYDAKKIKLDQYKNPAVFVNNAILSTWILILWIVFFPWYLSHRRNIREGKVPQKEAVKK